jgi:hypothetical protein
MVQLNLDSFCGKKDLKNEDRVNMTLSSSLKLRDCSDADVLDVMGVILSHYVMGKGGVFYLKNELCEHCRKKLKRKDVETKVYYLPGGHQMVLKFMRYSCRHCKKTPKRPHEEVFEKNKHYSSNIKNDSVGKYLNHMSSYSAVKIDINIEYASRVSRRTVRRWINEVALESKFFIFNNKNLSGHLVYDEEFMSVFEGLVGVKGAKLTKKRLFFHLFRDALTDAAFVYLSDSMDRENLTNIWHECFTHLIKKDVSIKSISTDGLSDYAEIIKLVNKRLIDEKLLTKEQEILHSYCVFHYQKNTYEQVKQFLFQSKYKKQEIPEHVKNQIKELHKFFEKTNLQKAQEHLETLNHQIQTFIPPIQKQIERLKKYFKEYTLHTKYPFLKTTNHAKQYFSNTKPEKIKKGYKTQTGLKNILYNMALKMMQKDWLKALRRTNNYTSAMHMFTRLVKGLKART